MEIRCSAYTSVFDKTPLVLSFPDVEALFAELKLGQVAPPDGDKNQAPLISQPSSWIDLQRLNRNVRTLGRILILDVDRLSNDGMADTLNRLRGFSVIVYTSYNHGVVKDGESLCRFRLIIELDREYPAEQHSAVWSAANARLGRVVDPKTKDPARMFTIPLLRPEYPQTEYLELWRGDPWSVDELLQEASYDGEGYVAETLHNVAREDLADLFSDWIRQRKSDHLRCMGRAGKRALDGVAIAEVGARNDTAFKLACQIIDRFPRGDPASIADHLAVGIATTDPSINFQNMLERRQGEVVEREKEKIRQRLDEQSSRIRQSFGGAREHAATESELTALVQRFNLERTPQMLKKLYIVGRGRFFYLLRPDGTYLEPQVDVNLQVAAERDLAVFSDFKAWTENHNGDPRRKTVQELLAEYSDVLDLVRYDMSARRTSYCPISKVMTVATCPPRWSPVFHQEVQTWLEGLDSSFLAVDMAAMMGRLDEIAPALVMTGGPDTGKTFFATVAAHIYSDGWTDMNEFTSGFNDVVRYCPIIVADEKPGAEYARNGSSFVRSHLSRKERSYDEKYKPKGKIYGAVRMIILANNLKVLATKEDLNTDDLRAFLERLVHLPIGEDSRRYLHSLGGSRYLDRVWLREGRGPEHFLWLSENWQIRNPGNRFAVGAESQDLYRKVFGRQGVKGEVITFLLNYLAAPELARNRQLTGVQVRSGKLYVQAKSIHTLWSTFMGNDKPPTQNEISRALAGGIATGGYKKLYLGNTRANFHQIETEVLRGALDEHHLTEDDFHRALGVDT